MSAALWLDVQPSTESDFQTIARTMFALMMRNVVTNGLTYDDPDPANHQKTAAAGCVLASPSYPTDFSAVPLRPPGNWTPSGRQNYVHNWTRDAAIVMMELCAPTAPIASGDLAACMADYVSFVALCQHNASSLHFDRACSTIDGQPRDPWSDQSDGPALQTLAILAYYDGLPAELHDIAKSVIEANIRFMLNPRNGGNVPVYQDTTTSPWEEESGHSFFARAVQLRCLQEIKDHPSDITITPGLDEAIAWLLARLEDHWNGKHYATFAPDTTVKPPLPWTPSTQEREPYDPNSDILMACVYGAVDVTNPRLLATAAAIRAMYDDADTGYPINQTDGELGYGPLIGRYPGDYYDGDVADSSDSKDHPWALTSCNLAEIYHRLATVIETGAPVPDDPLVEQFYAQIELPMHSCAQIAIAALRDAGDAILRAVVHHSDNLELSEQFDQVTGFQKSVSNLTWSYAAFLSAVRAR